ncbi:MAG: DUF1833 domain-containing protein [Sphaerospermopsis sp. SIO1G2]|nr:DUF1833 domain-containing protein [Sphaerospermopsis sp. SIO1G2]
MSLTDFYLNSDSSEVELETIQLSHSSFSKTYRFVRNASNGITATIEGNETVDFDYYPLRISKLGERNDMDFGVRIDLGDANRVLKEELELIRAADTFEEKPVLTYRTFQSSNLSAPLAGPFTLEVKDLTFTEGQVSFEAIAPRLNLRATGELYTLERFPMLRGVL